MVEPLPYLCEVYALLQQEEKQKQISVNLNSMTMALASKGHVSRKKENTKKFC